MASCCSFAAAASASSRCRASQREEGRGRGKREGEGSQTSRAQRDRCVRRKHSYQRRREAHVLSPLVAFACAMLPRAREGNAGSLARSLSRCTHLLLLSLAPCCLALGGQLILLPRAFVQCWQRHMQNSMPYPVCSGPDNRARQLCHSKSDAGSLRLCLSVSLFLCVSLSVSLSAVLPKE